MPKIRIALIGGGRMGEHHIPFYRRRQDVEICAFSDNYNFEEKAKKLELKGYPDYNEMIKKEKPDAVLICTPPKTHCAIIRDIASSGVAIFCEKPLAATEEEASDILETVERTGITFLTGFCHIFHGPVKKARELIDAGEIGDVKIFMGGFGGKGARATRPAWFNKLSTSGGGVILDGLGHSISVFRELCGEVKDTYAMADRVDFSDDNIEDVGVLLLKSEKGVIGQLMGSSVTPVFIPPGFQIFGDAGTIVIGYSGGEQLKIKKEGEAEWRNVEYDKTDRFESMSSHFIDIIKSAAQPECSVHDGYMVSGIIEKAYEVLK